jgi:hypothetical protein
MGEVSPRFALNLRGYSGTYQRRSKGNIWETIFLLADSDFKPFFLDSFDSSYGQSNSAGTGVSAQKLTVRLPMLFS